MTWLSIPHLSDAQPKVGVLNMLRAELEMHTTQVLERVNSALENLQKNGVNFDQEWTKVAVTVDKILKETPVACHRTTQVGDRGNKNISQHLQELSDEIKQVKKISEHQLSDLREVLEQWRKRVIDSEEAMS
jgi:archaellum component FlaC